MTRSSFMLSLILSKTSEYVLQLSSIDFKFCEGQFSNRNQLLFYPGLFTNNRYTTVSHRHQNEIIMYDCSYSNNCNYDRYDRSFWVRPDMISTRGQTVVFFVSASAKLTGMRCNLHVTYV